MPVYEYSHRDTETSCVKGLLFEEIQSISAEKLHMCPECGQEIFRVLSATRTMTSVGESQLKNNGFAKLVRRDKGLYENVTAQEGEKRFLDVRE